MLIYPSKHTLAYDHTSYSVECRFPQKIAFFKFENGHARIKFFSSHQYTMVSQVSWFYNILPCTLIFIVLPYDHAVVHFL